MPTSILLLAQFSILAFALLGGVFLAFSDFLMRALGNTSPSGGLEAMQSINREVFRYVFIPLFFVMVPVSIALAVLAYRNLAQPTPFIAAAAIYIVGVFGVTALGNVPMNNALEAMDAKTPEARTYWTETYLPGWTRWNTIRTIACVAASALVLYGITGTPESAATSYHLQQCAASTSSPSSSS